MKTLTNVNLHCILTTGKQNITTCVAVWFPCRQDVVMLFQVLISIGETSWIYDHRTLLTFEWFKILAICVKKMSWCGYRIIFYRWNISNPISLTFYYHFGGFDRKNSTDATSWRNAVSCVIFIIEILIIYYNRIQVIIWCPSLNRTVTWRRKYAIIQVGVLTLA